MTYPITPVPSIHNVPAAIQAQNNALTEQQLQALGQNFLDGIYKALLQIFLGGVTLGASPTTSGNAQALAAWAQSLATSASTAMQQIYNFIQGVINGALNEAGVVGTDIWSLIEWFFKIPATQLSGQARPATTPIIPASHVVNSTPELLWNSGFDTAASLGSLTTAPGISWDGTQGNKALGSAKVAPDGVHKFSIPSSPVPVVTAENLDLSIYAQWTALTTSGNTPPPIHMDLQQYYQGNLVTTSTLVPITSPATSAGWTQLSANFTVPSGVDTVYLVPVVDTTATGGFVWFDDASIQKAGQFDWATNLIDALTALPGTNVTGTGGPGTIHESVSAILSNWVSAVTGADPTLPASITDFTNALHQMTNKVEQTLGIATSAYNKAYSTTSYQYAPDTTTFSGAGNYHYTIPSYLVSGDYLDIIMIGAGGGGHQGATFGIYGDGGNAGAWTAVTLVYGTDIPTSTTVLSISIGAGGVGGSGGFGPGAAGGASTVTITGYAGSPLTAAGGAGGAGYEGSQYGASPGNQQWQNVTYYGGLQQNVAGFAGATPGGAGAGGNWLDFQDGGNGADGGVFIVARQASGVNSIVPPVAKSSATLLVPTVSIPNIVTLDALGAGSYAWQGTGSGNLSTSWSHTVGSDANYLIVGLQYESSGNYSQVSRSVTYGGYGMSSLGVVGWDANQLGVEFFGLVNPPTGHNTILAEIIAPFVNAYYVGGSSLSAVGVNTVSSLTSLFGASENPGLSVPSATGDLVVNLMGVLNAFTTATMSAYSETSIYYAAAPSADYPATQMGYAAGATLVEFLATAGSLSNEGFGAIGISLQPPP